MSKTVRVIILLCALIGPSFGAAQSIGTITLTPAEMQATAVASLRSGNAPRALAMSEALLLRDPTDALALETGARAALRMERSDVALERARTLYRTAPAAETRFVAARIAALAHAQQDQLTVAQIWLRRARQNAPTQTAADEIAADYRIVRQQNPVSYNFDFGISPSSNINNGSSEDTFSINLFGQTISLPFPEELKELSGYEITAAARLTYRLHDSPTSLTRASLGVETSQFFLSRESRERVPDFDASRLDAWYLNTGLDHIWAVGANNQPATVSLNYGLTWANDEIYASNVQLGLGRRWSVGEDAIIAANVALQRTLYRQTDLTADILSASMVYVQPLANGHSLSLKANAGRSRADAARYDYTFQSLGAGYDFGRIADTFDLFLNADYNWRNYGSVSNNAVTRADETLELGVSVGLPGFEVYGFEPVVSLLSERANSTSARFQTQTVSLDLNFRSSF